MSEESCGHKKRIVDDCGTPSPTKKVDRRARAGDSAAGRVVQLPQIDEEWNLKLPDPPFSIEFVSLVDPEGEAKCTENHPKNYRCVRTGERGTVTHVMSQQYQIQVEWLHDDGELVGPKWLGAGDEIRVIEVPTEARSTVPSINTSGDGTVVVRHSKKSLGTATEHQQPTVCDARQF